MPLTDGLTSWPYFTLQYTLHVLLDIPKAGNYRLLVKYTSEGQEVQTQAVIQYKNLSAAGPQAGEFFNFSLPLQECANCPAPIRTNNPKDYLLLRKGHWMVNITTIEPYLQLRLV